MNIDDLKFLLRETLEPTDLVYFAALVLMILALAGRLYLVFYGTPAP
jgi:hypothetical protein